MNAVLFEGVRNGAGPQFAKATVTYQDNQTIFDGAQSVTYDLEPCAEPQ